jgi:hypothetical protein
MIKRRPLQLEQLLAPVEHVDDGFYQSSLPVEVTLLTVVHNVEVYIAPELESRNWHHDIYFASDKHFNCSVVVGQILILLFLKIYNTSLFAL